MSRETAAVVEAAETMLAAMHECHLHRIGVMYDRLDGLALDAADNAWSDVWQAVGRLGFALQALDGKPRPLPVPS